MEKYHFRQVYRTIFFVTKLRSRTLRLKHNKYSALRTKSTKHDRFFVNYRNGRCTSQPEGINTIGGIPKVIAEYLNFKNPEVYTGHCFKRSSVNILADCGASMSTIKRFGGLEVNCCPRRLYRGLFG